MGRIALALMLLLVGCARIEPPAPIVDRTRIEPAMLTRAATGLLSLVGFTTPVSDVAPVAPISVVAEPGQQIAAAIPRQPKNDFYIVQRGDTVHQIARRQAVTSQSIIGINQLQRPYTLRVGQRLDIPARNWHTVAPGETLYGLSRQYEAEIEGLARLNNLRRPYNLFVGQRLAIPNKKGDNLTPPSIAALTVPAPRVAAGNTTGNTSAIPVPRPRPVELARVKLPQPRIRPSVPQRADGPVLAIGAPPPRAGGGFAWPVKGKLLTNFGPLDGGRRNEGVNIAAPRGTPVHAAENGVVAYAGNEIRGFGNLILVKHAGGVITAYAHAEALLVRRGDVVRKGQIIARVGTSGGVTAPQLHFEIREGAVAVDPTGLLSS
ncbi:MAG: peptidoglycan DD-metalloendopeptidase family protein [Alphaproteobacteria bacterium]